MSPPGGPACVGLTCSLLAGGYSAVIVCPSPHTFVAGGLSLSGESCVRAFACRVVGVGEIPSPFSGAEEGVEGICNQKGSSPCHQPHPDKPHTRGSPASGPSRMHVSTPRQPALVSHRLVGGPPPSSPFLGAEEGGERLQKGDRKRPKVWVRSVKLRGYAGGSSEKGDSGSPPAPLLPKKVTAGSGTPTTLQPRRESCRSPHGPQEIHNEVTLQSSKASDRVGIWDRERDTHGTQPLALSEGTGRAC
jgi:hypothetical protein